MYFEDRVDAGRRLAELLLERGYLGDDTLILGLPRGGVPGAYEMAAALGAVAEGGIQALQVHRPARLLLAVPVAATQALADLNIHV